MLIFAVRVYRLVISPAKLFLVGPLGQCRFHPTCSVYASEAIARHGALRGSWLALKRLGRCHPWGGSGEDPVPPVAPASARAFGVRQSSGAFAPAENGAIQANTPQVKQPAALPSAECRPA